jgi:ATP synthase protein I
MTGDHEPSPAGAGELGRRVGSRERRKVRVRGSRDRTLWHGLGTAGIIGWSIAVPTVLGALLGLWIDRRWPGELSWTLALLLAGVSLGCLSAWYWVRMESRMIEREESGEDAAR